jgi:hypothetical protein
LCPLPITKSTSQSPMRLRLSTTSGHKTHCRS